MKKILVLICFYFFIANSSFSQNKIDARVLIQGINLSLFETSEMKGDYYGLFHTADLSAETRQKFELKKINLLDYSDYKRVKSDKLIFVLSGFDLPNKDVVGWIPDVALKNPFPGQSFIFEFANENYNLFAKGKVIDEPEPKTIRVFSGIQNYTLCLRTSQNGIIIDHTIDHEDFIERRGFGSYIGEITIEWIGDLNGDNELDIITCKIIHHECSELKLLSLKKNKIVEIYKTTICGG